MTKIPRWPALHSFSNGTRRVEGKILFLSRWWMFLWSKLNLMSLAHHMVEAVGWNASFMEPENRQSTVLMGKIYSLLNWKQLTQTWVFRTWTKQGSQKKWWKQSLVKALLGHFLIIRPHWLSWISLLEWILYLFQDWMVLALISHITQDSP